jgi:hypothetical protein
MKQIRIASTIADTIAAGVTSFKGTLATLGGGPWAYGIAISQMAATLAAGYAQVRKLRNLTIGSGGAGGGAAGAGSGSAPGARFTQRSGRMRERRVQNFVRERSRDTAQSAVARETAKAVREEQAKTRRAIREGMAIGDEAAFESREAARAFEQKATS